MLFHNSHAWHILTKWSTTWLLVVWPPWSHSTTWTYHRPYRILADGARQRLQTSLKVMPGFALRSLGTEWCCGSHWTSPIFVLSWAMRMGPLPLALSVYLAGHNMLQGLHSGLVCLSCVLHRRLPRVHEGLSLGAWIWDTSRAQGYHSSQRMSPLLWARQISLHWTITHLGK